MEDGVYSTVAFSERVDRSPHGGYVCFIACKVINIFLLGFPCKVVDTVLLLFVSYERGEDRERERRDRDREGEGKTEGETDRETERRGRQREGEGADRDTEREGRDREKERETETDRQTGQKGG